MAIQQALKDFSLWKQNLVIIRAALITYLNFPLQVFYGHFQITVYKHPNSSDKGPIPERQIYENIGCIILVSTISG